MNNIAVLDFSVQKDDLKTPCFSFLRCEETANCLVGSGLFQTYTPGCNGTLSPHPADILAPLQLTPRVISRNYAPYDPTCQIFVSRKIASRHHKKVGAK